jgi:hypothetical protein
MTVEVNFRLPQEWTLLGTTGVSVCRCSELKRKAFVMLSCSRKTNQIKDDH